MIGLSDILTAIKNLVQAVSNLAVRRQASAPAPASGGAQLAISGSGTLLGYSVVVAGTAPGTVYDSNLATSTPPTAAILSIPNTLGFFPVALAFQHGLVVVPGTGQTVVLSFSTS